MARAESYEFAFRRRYNLPPTDPRYLAMTVEDIIVDYWAHRFWDDPKLKEEFVDPDFEAGLAEMEAQSRAVSAEISNNDDWETVSEFRGE